MSARRRGPEGRRHRRVGASGSSPRSLDGDPDAAAGDRGFGPLNLVLFLAALVVIVVGYWLLARGSITAAPLLLVLGYVILIPVALLVRRRRPRESV